MNMSSDRENFCCKNSIIIVSNFNICAEYIEAERWLLILYGIKQ